MNRRTFLEVAAAAALAIKLAQTPRLICFGDSITEGRYSSTPALAYAALVASALGYALDNRAIGGTRIAEQLDQEILITRVYPPDVALFLTGYNDMRFGTPLADFQASLAQACAWLTQDGATLYLGDCVRGNQAGYALYGPFDKGSDVSVAQFNQIIHAQSGARHVFASAAFDPANSDPRLAHPNDAGHAQIAAAFLRAMRVRACLPYIGR